MDFHALLDQVAALLRRRGRVTSRALKGQFQLDDDALEALKDELIYAQQLAVDEDGKVLVWTGRSESTPNRTSRPEGRRGRRATPWARGPGSSWSISEAIASSMKRWRITG